MAATLGFNGPAGAPSGVEALTVSSGNISGMVLTGGGALNLGTVADAIATLSGVGPVGDGTVTVNWAPGSQPHVFFYFGQYTLLYQGRVELYGPSGQMFTLGATPSASFGVSIQGGTALILLDGKVICATHADPATFWGPIRIGSGNYPGNFAVDSITVSPTPLPLPVLAPQPVAPHLVSTSVPAGYIVLDAQVATTGPTQLVQAPGDLQSYGITGADAALFFMRGDGHLTTGQALPPGDKHISITTTDRGTGLTRTDALTIPVPAGTLLPSSNMTFTPAGPLNNYATGQLVGTPAVAGITGTPSWTLDNRHNNNYAPPGFNALFACDPATGRTTIPGMAEEGAETLTWTCSDGTNTCTASFSVPIAWYVPAAGKRTVHVGQGMQAAHGADGYEQFRDLMPELANRGGGLSAGNAGMDVQWHWNGDPNYFADDNGGGQNGAGINDQSTRFGIHGPISFTPVRGPNGELVRIGGRISAPFGGMDAGSKGFFNKASGDMRINPGFEISWVNGAVGGDPSQGSYAGISAIRSNGGCWGKLEVRGCFFHNNNNGIEAGDGPVTTLVDGCEFGNHGTAYVSSGATHSLYMGNHTQTTITNNRFGPVNNGHNIKSRAFRGLYQGNTIRGGNRDLASACIDIPDGGHHTVRNNVLVKGANHANDAALQYGVERLTGARTDALVLDGNTYVMLEPRGRHAGSIPVALRVAFVVGIDGSQGTVTSTNERFYMAGAAQKSEYSNRDGANGTLTQTGAVDLAVPPAVDTSHIPGASRVGPMNYTFDQSQNYPNTAYEQIDLGVEDYLLLPLGTAAGTVIAPAVTAYGNNQFKEVGPNDIRIQPFVAGTTWALPQTAQPDGNTVPWAAAGRYSIAVNPDGITATLKVLQPPAAAGVDFLQLLATAPGGIQCQYRAAVCWA